MKKHNDKILRAAVVEFSKQGFHQARVEEIARRAGVGKGTLYLYYPSKSELFSAAVTDGLERIIAKLGAALDSDLPFMQHFRVLIEESVTLYLRYGDLARIITNELSNGIDPKTLGEIETVRERFVLFMADMLDDGYRRGYIKQIDFHLAAVSIVGLLDTLSRRHFKNPRKVKKEQIVDIMYSMLSSGLLNRRD